MTGIIDFALAKAKTTMMIALMVVVAGSYARQEIPIAASPNVQLPFISVSVFLDGASPGDTSRLIARPLENRLKNVTGVKNIRSTSSLSFARIFLEFEVGFDMDQALVDIKQSVEETKYELPREAEDPQISEYSESSFPIMNISIVGSSSVRQKVFYAKELKDRTESIEEILQARLTGAPEEVLEVAARARARHVRSRACLRWVGASGVSGRWRRQGREAFFDALRAPTIRENDAASSRMRGPVEARRAEAMW